MAPNPYIKQYLMTAGPTPLPPAVSQVMAEPITYHRAPAFVDVYASALERLRDVFQTRNQVSLLRILGDRRDGVGGRQSGRARGSRRRRLGRQVRRALAGALPGLRWRGGPPGRRVGRGDRTRPARGHHRRHGAAAEGRLRDPVRDLDRRRPRRSRPDRGCPRSRCRHRRGRCLGPRRRRPAAGRVGGGRGGGGLAEVADVPARPRLRLGQRARRWSWRPRSPGGATTSTGRGRRTARGRTRPTAPSRPPSPCGARSTSRWA